VLQRILGDDTLLRQHAGRSERATRACPACRVMSANRPPLRAPSTRARPPHRLTPQAGPRWLLGGAAHVGRVFEPLPPISPLHLPQIWRTLGVYLSIWAMRSRPWSLSRSGCCTISRRLRGFHLGMDRVRVRVRAWGWKGLGLGLGLGSNPNLGELRLEVGQLLHPLPQVLVGRAWLGLGLGLGLGLAN